MDSCLNSLGYCTHTGRLPPVVVDTAVSHYLSGMPAAHQPVDDARHAAIGCANWALMQVTAGFSGQFPWKIEIHDVLAL